MGVPLVSDLRLESESLPCPGFEGSEKRLELEFQSDSSHLGGLGLRALFRAEIDDILKQAECTIVSQLSNDCLDSYVLSESSLFIYPFRIVMKTCGTTQLLLAIPSLLEAAKRLHLTVHRCKYTRGTFIFPSAQAFPHDHFENEVAYLEKHFGRLGSGKKSAVMGDASHSRNWHIYNVAAGNQDATPMYTMEMCMTELNREAAAQFYKTTHASAARMTEATGISEILPASAISAFAFDPCGYSMNGIERAAHSTIHVTPENGFSYASFEAMGYEPGNIDLRAVVDKVIRIFKPAVFSLALDVTGSAGVDHVRSFSVCPRGYVVDGTSQEEFQNRVVIFHTYRAEMACEETECLKPPNGVKTDNQVSDRIHLLPCASSGLMHWSKSGMMLPSY